MSDATGKVRITTEEMSRHLDEAFEAVEASRASGFDEVLRTRELRARMYRRERDVAVRELGDAHPSVRAIDERLDLNELFVDGLKAERKQAERVAPEPDPAAWILHGIVTDRRRRSLGGLIIRLHKPTGGRLRKLDSTLTESDGTFLLSIPISIKAGGDDRDQKIAELEAEKAKELRKADKTRTRNVKEIEEKYGNDRRRAGTKRKALISLQKEHEKKVAEINKEFDRQIAELSATTTSTDAAVPDEVVVHVLSADGETMLKGDRTFSPQANVVDSIELTVLADKT